MFYRTHLFAACAAAVLASLSAGYASAAQVTFAGTSGGLGASALFDVTGTTLTVTLTNTGTGDVTDPAGVLTGVYWNSSVPLTLTRVSAGLAPGSIVTFDNAPYLGSQTNIGGEYAYSANESGTPGGRTYGLGAVGIGLGASDVFPGGTFDSTSTEGAPPDGLAGGLLPTADNPATGNGGVDGRALVKNAVMFQLSGMPAGFSLNSISSVWFQYGTSTTEPGFDGPPTGEPRPPVPLPPAVLAGGLLLAGLAGKRAFRKV